MPAKLNTQQFIEKAVSVHGTKYDYSSTEYFGNDKKLDIVCLIHGIFSQRPNDHLSKRAGCPECSGVKRYTTEQFVAKARNVHGKLYDYKLVTYKNTETKVSIVCRLHGVFKQTPHDHLQGAGCPHCAGVAKGNTDSFIAEATKIHKNRYDYSKANYVTNRRKVTIICKLHGEFKQSPIGHIRGQGCPVCGGVKPMYTQDFIQKAVVVHGSRYSYERTLYTKKTNNLIVTCKKHGDFPQLPFNHLAGSGCPECSDSNTSNQETILMAAFAKYNPIREKETLCGKELDLHFKDHKVAVEVNGIYWHSDIKKPEKYHIDKTLRCAEAGIKLLHFTETEVNRKLPIVSSIVLNALGVSNKIHARVCDLRQVTFSDYDKFFQENHISGNVPAKIAFGLYLGDELVSCMSFSKPRFDKSCQWEIIRFASKLGTNVIGGASRLFTAFLRDQSPTSVLSYADIRYGNGNVYTKLGFEYSRSTSPGYSYHHINGSVVSRMQAQKHKLPTLLGTKFDPSKSERENMLSCGYMKMFDCGHKVFVWTK